MARWDRGSTSGIGARESPTGRKAATGSCLSILSIGNDAALQAVATAGQRIEVAACCNKPIEGHD
jgi:hypothetical protein